MNNTLSAGNLRDYGGKTLPHASFVSLYAGNFWGSPAGQGQSTALDRCSASIPTGKHTSVWREYGLSKGTFAGSAKVSLAGTKKTVTEQDVRSLEASTISRTGVKRPDGQTVYTLFLPSGVTLASGNADSRHGLGGFHGSYTDATSGKRVYYAAIAYSDETNGVHFTNNSVDNILIAASHEWSEAVTDPDANAGRVGWYDRNYGEIGDIPISVGYPLGQLWGRVDGCAVQKEWSNAQGKPVLTE